jgi:hypothetical protein
MAYGLEGSGTHKGALRGAFVATAQIPSGQATSHTVPVGMTRYASLWVGISGAWTDAHIGLYALLDGNIWVPVRGWTSGYASAIIHHPSGQAMHQGPPRWGGAVSAIRLWSQDGTGADVAQEDDRPLTLYFKS